MAPLPSRATRAALVCAAIAVTATAPSQAQDAEGLSGTATFGFSATTGNSESSNLTAGLHSCRSKHISYLLEK